MRSGLLVFGVLWLAACEGQASDPRSVPPPELQSDQTRSARSPDELDPTPAPPSEQLTGAPAAALFQAALRTDDPVRATRMFERACDAQVVPACIAFADALEAGGGVEADAERARVVLEQACMDGATIACDRLGH